MKLEADGKEITPIIFSTTPCIGYHFCCEHVPQELSSLRTRLEAAEAVVRTAENIRDNFKLKPLNHEELLNKELGELEQALAHWKEMEK